MQYALQISVLSSDYTRQTVIAKGTPSLYNGRIQQRYSWMTNGQYFACGQTDMVEKLHLWE